MNESASTVSAWRRFESAGMSGRVRQGEACICATGEEAALWVCIGEEICEEQPPGLALLLSVDIDAMTWMGVKVQNGVA